MASAADAPPTFGVEEEFLLVDPTSGEPVAANRAVTHHAEERRVELELELTSCQVETTSAVLDDSADMLDELTRLRRVAAEAAHDSGAQLLAVALPHHFPITDKPRYRKIADEFGFIAHEQGICGCHVHVAVPDRDAAIHASNWLRPWLPSLLALTANSAIYRSADTGYASWRSILWARWPSAGPPPHFDSAADYDAKVQTLLDTGAAVDEGMVYWDVRPSRTFPTIEVRASDVPATAAETVLLATLVRAGVMTALESPEAPRPSDLALRAAYWRAARDGVAGEAVDLTGEPTLVPATRLLGTYIHVTRKALDRLGERDRVTDELNRIAAQGNGAMRQRKAWSRNNDAHDVIAEAAAATLS